MGAGLAIIDDPVPVIGLGKEIAGHILDDL